jgi:hypothetical protein
MYFVSLLTSYCPFLSQIVIVVVLTISIAIVLTPKRNYTHCLEAIWGLDV